MEKIEFFLFQISLLLYLSGGILYILEVYFSSRNFGDIPLWKIRIAFLFHSASIVISHIRAESLLIFTLFEALSIFSWITVLLYLIVIHKKLVPKTIGAFILPVVFIINIYGFIGNREFIIRRADFQHFWFFIHVPLTFFSYGCFTIAFCGAVIYFIQEKNLKSKNIGNVFKKLPSLIVIDEFAYKMVLTGFPLLTLGIITGAIWAHTVWGSFFSWNPKEICALLTLFIYAVYLHSRLLAGWRGYRTNLILIAGFICIIITFLLYHRRF